MTEVRQADRGQVEGGKQAINMKEDEGTEGNEEVTSQTPGCLLQAERAKLS